MHVIHRPWSPDAHAMDPTTLRLTVWIERASAHKVWVHYGDRYALRRQYCVEMALIGQSAAFDVYRADIRLQAPRFQYLFEIEERANGAVTYGADGVGQDLATDRPFQFAHILPRDVFTVPEWAASAICYEIFPDRFYRPPGTSEQEGDRPLVAWTAAPTPTNFWGGTLAGISEKMPYLADLGINLVYLTPVFRSGSNHRYDVEDYYVIDPLLGTEADLVTLVERAHERGIRVMLDAVFNHTSDRFFAFQDCVANGTASEYWDWYLIEGDKVRTRPVNYQTFANGIASMPKLNFSNPNVEAYFLEVARYWIGHAGIDGWRLDVANEVDHVFWRRFRDAVKSVRHDALIVGEVWHDPTPWLHGDQFDGVMNYRFRTIIEDFFVRQKLAVAEFAYRLDDLQCSLPSPAGTASFNLLGSHDTERIFTLLDEDMARYLLVLVLLLTWHGIPMIYYGDELAMTGGADPGCRKGMDWSADCPAPSYPAIRKLLRLRSRHPALQSGTTRIDHGLASKHVLQYHRVHETEEMVVTLNFSGDPLVLPQTRHMWFRTADEQSSVLQPGHAEIWSE